jgi:hypothetical protein
LLVSCDFSPHHPLPSLLATHVIAVCYTSLYVAASSSPTRFWTRPCSLGTMRRVWLPT